MTEHIGLKVFAEACGRFKLFSEQVVVPTKYCKNFITGAFNPQMNYVYELCLDHLDGLAHDFAKLTRSGFPMLVLCESEAAHTVGDFFKKNGLVFSGSVQSKIRTLENFSYTPSDKIKMNEVSTLEMLDTWRDIAAKGFCYPKECDEQLFNNFYQSGEHHKFVKLFLAYVDNIPMGQSMLVLGDNLSANMWSSVLPEYRKQGVLTEMLQQRIYLSKKLGFNQNVVQCMPMSASVYDKNNYQNREVLNIYAINTN